MNFKLSTGKTIWQNINVIVKLKLRVNMPKKTTKTIKETTPINIGNIIAMIILVAIIGLGGIYLAKYNANRNPAKQVAAAQTINYDCNEGQTVLSVLEEKAEIKIQNSDYGVYVDEINGAANGDNGFWIYYVNSEMGQVGADQYQCKTDDKIEWRFEQLLQ